ncbi:MAM and LDL-receptor class A domain-containing protein 1-like [Saccostrea echinata]|uniref:MAM and LDL-receptor class A domain-containing protein 1-like n=1 Tax=Saccostrea echinata TaxID=191078 RepID=UPI002A820FD0|nr:MAM and LDL-receptor class A domain-containing protein 1-like [Saccostrea echinata]
MWLVTLVGSCLLFVGCIKSQFQPGCSFSNGQCIYNVKLGHAQTCDAAGSSGQASTTTHSSSNGCSCDDIHKVGTDVTSLRTTVSDLQKAVDKLYSEMNISRSELTQTQDLLHGEQQHAAELLVTLNSKQKMLNQSKEELANVLLSAKTELDNLREQLINASKQLSICQGNAGLPTTTTQVYSEYSTFYCGFENYQGSLCNFQTETDSSTSSSLRMYWSKQSGRHYSVTGPNMDHTYETSSGHYMVIDAQYISQHSSSTSEHNFRLVSPTFEPAQHYCIRFWYNMHGTDVKPLKVYAKIGGGLGNPIKVIQPVNSVDWKLGEVEIGSEYTVNKFQVVFEGSTDAHYRYSYHTHGSTKSYVNENGNVAIDDVYIYNTTCQDVPKCPSNSYTHVNMDNTTSCYTFHATPKSWYNAINECKKESYGGHLASITDQMEQDYLVNLIMSDIGLMTAGQSGFYISGNDENSENNFVWTDGGSPSSLTYSNWYPGQPNNVGSNQDCLLMQYPDAGYQWGDVSCTETHPFICESRY